MCVVFEFLAHPLDATPFLEMAMRYSFLEMVNDARGCWWSPVGSAYAEAMQGYCYTLRL
jgi:hypothetical protein